MKVTIEWDDANADRAEITVDGHVYSVHGVPFGWEVGPVEDKPDDAPDTLADRLVQNIGDSVWKCMQSQIRISRDRGARVLAHDPLTDDEADDMQDTESDDDDNY